MLAERGLDGLNSSNGGGGSHSPPDDLYRFGRFRFWTVHCRHSDSHDVQKTVRQRCKEM